MKKHLSTLLLVTTIGMGSTAIAQTPGWLDVSGSVNFDGTASKNNDWERDLRAQDAELRFEILAREGVRLVIKAELERVLNNAINDEDTKLEIEKMLEEAYIQIETDKVSGLPRAIITVGKHRMAFGQKLSQLPMFKDSLLYKLNNEEEMIGLTVQLPANFLKLVDEVAISLYETGAGDFKISKDKAASIQVSKQLSSQIQMQISALLKQHEGSDLEKRGSIGFVFTSEDGNLKLWAQGMVMDKNPEYLNSRYAGSIGAAVKMGVGVIVVEASYLENNAKELAVAYNMPIGSHLVLSPEVRYTKQADGSDDTTVGIRARLQFGKEHGKVTKGPRA